MEYLKVPIKISKKKPVAENGIPINVKRKNQIKQMFVFASNNETHLYRKRTTIASLWLFFHFFGLTTKILNKPVSQTSELKNLK